MERDPLIDYNVIYWNRTNYNDIRIETDKKGTKILYLNNVLKFEKDRIYYEALVHVPMYFITSPCNVLIIGGGDGGILRELVKYPIIRSIDMIEQDEQIIKVTKRFFPQMLKSYNDFRVFTYISDPFDWINNNTQKEYSYHLIIIDLPGDSNTIFWSRLKNYLATNGSICRNGHHQFTSYKPLKAVSYYCYHSCLYGTHDFTLLSDKVSLTEDNIKNIPSDFNFKIQQDKTKCCCQIV